MTSKYLILIEEAEGNYSAYSPDLPGCVATGDDIDEVKQNMKEAIELHLEGLREEEMAIPGPKTIADYVAV